MLHCKTVHCEALQRTEWGGACSASRINKLGIVTLELVSYLPATVPQGLQQMSAYLIFKSILTDT